MRELIDRNLGFVRRADGVDERNNSAKEVSTLAAQLTRTRETNKSLTEANRALLSAKQSEAPAVSQQDFDQLQAKVRELTAAGDELRRQNEKLTGDSQSLLGELAAEKTALQERLEAVGTQLIKMQQENDVLQKQNAEATAQIAASQQTAEQARA
ncbi:MAG: peptidoglycan-binding LysM, partial [Candidatus Peregrinibacteria bacterium Greene0416_62]